MSSFEADVTIVGSGIAGLWSAKELVDEGLSVQIVEKSETLAHGATTKNEGWLHAGTYHAVAIEKDEEIVSVVNNTRWSHEKIIDFAPESIDHVPTFTITTSDELADKAIKRWQQTGVTFREVAKQDIGDASAIDIERLSAAFRVDDKSVNSRVLCQKLARYVAERGGRFFTGAHFMPNDTTTADILQGSSRHTLTTNHFLVTAGSGVQGIVEQITGQHLPMRLFKAHLLVVPRLTVDNYFHLEAGEAGLMNHGDASVVGINRDGIELLAPDEIIVADRIELIRTAAARMFSSAVQHKLANNTGVPVVCSKPDISGHFGETQSLDVKIFEPAPNYICGLPGKMTMAPYFAKEVTRLILGRADTRLSYSNAQSNQPVAISPRPVDDWLSTEVA